ncbi:MAG: hypothetical protein U0556_01640 [Dehalococcoidia bacterium]
MKRTVHLVLVAAIVGALAGMAAPQPMLAQSPPNRKLRMLPPTQPSGQNSALSQGWHSQNLEALDWANYNSTQYAELRAYGYSWDSVATTRSLIVLTDWPWLNCTYAVYVDVFDWNNQTILGGSFVYVHTWHANFSSTGLAHHAGWYNNPFSYVISKIRDWGEGDTCAWQGPHVHMASQMSNQGYPTEWNAIYDTANPPPYLYYLNNVFGNWERGAQWRN